MAGALLDRWLQGGGELWASARWAFALAWRCHRGFLTGRIFVALLGGLVPAVVQDDATNEVLMVGFMNADALARTRETGFVTFFSRSRNALWTKGETSGNRLAVRDILIDCDDDTVLIKAECLGGGHVCHTGARSCFFQRAEGVTIP